MIPAIILARGGSRRLPRKNILPFCGHPLLAWSIAQINCCKADTMAFVSTDDDEVAEIAEMYGAIAIMRPDWPNPNELSAGTPMLHAIKWIEGKNYHYDTYIPVLPVAPVRAPDDIDNSIRLYDKLHSRKLITLYNPRETVTYEKLGQNLVQCILFDKNYNYLTQGGHWCVLDKNYAKEEIVAGMEDRDADKELAKKPGKIIADYYPLKWWQQFDIDDADDFEQCEYLMRTYVLKGRGIEMYKEYGEGAG